MSKTVEYKRTESKLEVQTYLDKLKYAIQSGNASVNFQQDRKVDKDRDKRHTNKFTVSSLFPDDDVVVALKRELLLLTVEDYIETVKDYNFERRSEMRVFSKQYSGADVYIKIRVELVCSDYTRGGGSHVFIMSFHFSEWTINVSDFPYKKA